MVPSTCKGEIGVDNSFEPESVSFGAAFGFVPELADLVGAAVANDEVAEANDFRGFLGGACGWLISLAAEPSTSEARAETSTLPADDLRWSFAGSLTLDASLAGISA